MSNSVQENRLRRKAKRQGLALRGTGAHDPDSPDYLKYRLIDAETGSPTTDLLTLNQIEHVLYRANQRA